MEFAGRRRRAGRPATLPVRGEIDLDAIDGLDAAFDRVRADHPSVVRVDLSDVEFIDSTGLNAFVRWNQEGQRTGFHVVFVGATPATRRLLHLTRLDELLTIER